MLTSTFTFLHLLLLTGTFFDWDGASTMYSLEKTGQGWAVVAYDGSHHELRRAALPRRPRAICATGSRVVIAYREGGLETRDATTLAQRLFRSTDRVYISLACDGTHLYAGGRFLGVEELSWDTLAPVSTLPIRFHSWACCMETRGDQLYVASWDHGVRIHPSGVWFTHRFPVHGMSVSDRLVGVLLTGSRLKLWSHHGRLLFSTVVKGAKSLNLLGNFIALGMNGKRLMVVRFNGRTLVRVWKGRIPLNPLEVRIMDSAGHSVFVHDGTKSFLWIRQRRKR